MTKANRYKTWNLFNRKPQILLPSIVRYVNLIDAYRSSRIYRATEPNPYSLTAIGCSFEPDDAGTIGTVATFPYYLLNQERFRVPCGYVSVWDICEEECENNGILFTYAVQPSPTFSHCGNIYAAVMNSAHGQVSVVGYDMEENDKYFDSVPLEFWGGNLLGKTLNACVNHGFAVTITNMKMQNDLDICNFSVWRVKTDLTLRHRGTTYVDTIVGHSLLGVFLLDAAFSPDSNYYGMLMSNNSFVLIDIHSRKMKTMKKLGIEFNCAVKSFCFHPKFTHRVIAVHSEQSVYIASVTEDECNAKTIDIPEQHSANITHISYSKDGYFFGVCLANGKTLIYSCDPRYVLRHVLNPATCQDTIPELFKIENIIANRVSFSSASEEVCVAYSNGYVCVWQLPRKLKLKDICRLNVLCLYSMDTIESLDIPRKLKQFLRFEPMYV